VSDMDSNPLPEERRLFMNIAQCTGCRSCEVMCSFHHCGGFNPNLSSIIVTRNDIEGTVNYKFLTSCDLCEGLPIPACVAACSPHALCMK